MDKSIPLGKLFGISIKLHVLFVALLALQVSFGFAVGGKYWALFYFIILGPLLLATILIHELGHCLAARSVGGEAHSILLWPLGGLAFIGHTAGPKADMWVAVAGPLTHIPQIILYVILLLPVHKANYGDSQISLIAPDPSQHLGEAILVGALLMNIGLLLFNLFVPAYPLDGGRILADMLLACGVAPATAAKITVGFAAPISIAIAVAGIYFVELVLVLVGLWILFSTYQLFDCIRKGDIHTHPLFAEASSRNTYRVDSTTYYQQDQSRNLV